MKAETKTQKSLVCYHCGDECKDDSIKIDEKLFCCNGCKTVYEILDQNKLCNYYNLEQNPGISPNFNFGNRFDYLDDPSTIQKILDFQDENISKATFHIPQMHCSSCIWLLENLFKINPAIIHSEVDFLKKKLSVKFNPNKMSLKEQLSCSLQSDTNLRYFSKMLSKRKRTNQKLFTQNWRCWFLFSECNALFIS